MGVDREVGSPAPLRRWRRLAVVAAGLGLSVAGGAGAVALRSSRIDPADAAASGGMHAFGDLLLFIATTGLLALAPTAALFLSWRRDPAPARRPRLLLAWAATAPLGTLAFWAGRFTGGERGGWNALLALASALGLLRVFVSPISLAAILLSLLAFVTPEARRRVRWAAGLEAVALLGLLLIVASAMRDRLR
jgi:hypothetical protein